MGEIYKITNTIDGKSYIGQTVKSAEVRFKRHITENKCSLIHRAIKKHGKEVFILTVLHANVPNEQLDGLEQRAIKEHNTLVPNGYNLDTGGKSNKVLSPVHRLNISKGMRGKQNTLGKKPSADTRRKISEANKGNKNSLGKKHTIETRIQMSEAHKGKQFSDEHRRNLSKSQRGNTKKLGKKVSAEALRNMSEAQRRRRASERKKHQSH